MFMLPQIDIKPLLDLRNEWTDMAPLDWWTDAANALRLYEPPPALLTVKHADRKWEIVSAYQKAVRRSDVEWALKMVSAMCSIPAELGYFWKRVTCVAAEDVGPGDVHTMNFVIQASRAYTPKKDPEQQYRVLCFLTEMMCETTRSHDYCRMVVIEHMHKNGVKPKNLTEDESALLAHFLAAPDEIGGWALKNNWRGEGMLKFQLASGLQLIAEPWPEEPWPEPAIVKGLPSYAYDMHTRAGKQMLAMLSGFKIVKDFLLTHPTIRQKIEILGDAVFYEEGILIANEVRDPVLKSLELRYAAAEAGWSVDTWMEFRGIIRPLLASGAIDKLREKVALQQEY